MRKKRTVALVASIAATVAAACGGEEATNCDPVTGVYYPEFELLAVVELDGGIPADCTQLPVDRLDLTGDVIITNSTSIETIDVWKAGCEAKVTYTRAVVGGTDMTRQELFNNQGTKYAVEAGGLLHGETVYRVRDRNGVETCMALFDTRWLTEVMHEEELMRSDAGPR